MDKVFVLDECEKISLESAKDALRKFSERFHILIHQTDQGGFEQIMQSDRFAGQGGLNGTSLLTSYGFLDQHISAVNGGSNNHRGSTHLVVILAPKIAGQEKLHLDNLDGIDTPLDREALGIGTDLVFGAFSGDSFIKNSRFQTRENYPRATLENLTGRTSDISHLTTSTGQAVSGVFTTSYLPPPPDEVVI